METKTTSSKHLRRQEKLQNCCKKAILDDFDHFPPSSPSGWKKTKISSALGIEKRFRRRKKSKTWFFVFYCVLCLIGQILEIFARKWASGRWNVDFEHPTNNLRFLYARKPKYFRPKLPRNAIFLDYWYEIFRNLQNFLKLFLRCRFGHCKPKTLQ